MDGWRLAAAPTADGNLCVVVDAGAAGRSAGCGARLDDERPVAALLVGEGDGLLVLGVAADGVAGVEALGAGGVLCSATVARNAFACRVPAADAESVVAWRARLADGSTAEFAAASTVIDAVRAAAEASPPDDPPAADPAPEPVPDDVRQHAANARKLVERVIEGQTVEVWAGEAVPGEPVMPCPHVVLVRAPTSVSAGRQVRSFGCDEPAPARTIGSGTASGGGDLGGIAWMTGHVGEGIASVVVVTHDGRRLPASVGGGWYLWGIGQQYGGFGADLPERVVGLDAAGAEVASARTIIPLSERGSGWPGRPTEVRVTGVRQALVRVQTPGGPVTLQAWPVRYADDGSRGTQARLVFAGREVQREAWDPRTLQWPFAWWIHPLGRGHAEAVVVSGVVQAGVRVQLHFQDGARRTVATRAGRFLVALPADRWAEGRRLASLVGVDASGRVVQEVPIATAGRAFYPRAGGPEPFAPGAIQVPIPTRAPDAEFRLPVMDGDRARLVYRAWRLPDGRVTWGWWRHRTGLAGGTARLPAGATPRVFTAPWTSSVSPQRERFVHGRAPAGTRYVQVRYASMPGARTQPVRGGFYAFSLDRAPAADPTVLEAIGAGGRVLARIPLATVGTTAIASPGVDTSVPAVVDYRDPTRQGLASRLARLDPITLRMLPGSVEVGRTPVGSRPVAGRPPRRRRAAGVGAAAHREPAAAGTRATRDAPARARTARRRCLGGRRPHRRRHRDPGDAPPRRAIASSATPSTPAPAGWSRAAPSTRRAAGYPHRRRRPRARAALRPRTDRRASRSSTRPAGTVRPGRARRSPASFRGRCIPRWRGSSC